MTLSFWVTLLAVCVFVQRKGDFMQAIKAIYDGVNFKPKQAIPVSGQYEVVITFVEQTAIDTSAIIQDQLHSDINFQ